MGEQRGGLTDESNGVEGDERLRKDKSLRCTRKDEGELDGGKGGEDPLSLGSYEGGERRVQGGKLISLETVDFGQRG